MRDFGKLHRRKGRKSNSSTLLSSSAWTENVLDSWMEQRLKTNDPEIFALSVRLFGAEILLLFC